MTVALDDAAHSGSKALTETEREQIPAIQALPSSSVKLRVLKTARYIRQAPVWNKHLLRPAACVKKAHSHPT